MDKADADAAAAAAAAKGSGGSGSSAGSGDEDMDSANNTSVKRKASEALDEHGKRARGHGDGQAGLDTNDTDE